MTPRSGSPGSHRLRPVATALAALVQLASCARAVTDRAAAVAEPVVARGIQRCLFVTASSRMTGRRPRRNALLHNRTRRSRCRRVLAPRHARRRVDPAALAGAQRWHDRFRSPLVERQQPRRSVLHTRRAVRSGPRRLRPRHARRSRRSFWGAGGSIAPGDVAHLQRVRVAKAPSPPPAVTRRVRAWVLRLDELVVWARAGGMRERDEVGS